MIIKKAMTNNAIYIVQELHTFDNSCTNLCKHSCK